MRRAAEQRDEADKALGGTRLGWRRRLVHPERRRVHRLAAYPWCSADLGRLMNSGGTPSGGRPESDDFQKAGIARLKRLHHRVAATFWAFVFLLFVLEARSVLVDGVDAGQVISDLGLGDRAVLCVAVLATGVPFTSLGERRAVRIAGTMALLFGIIWLGVWWVGTGILYSVLWR